MALDKYFPAEEGVEIIAEPGRYFVASAYTLGVNIIAKRVVARDQQGESMCSQSFCLLEVVIRKEISLKLEVEQK